MLLQKRRNAAQGAPKHIKDACAQINYFTAPPCNSIMSDARASESANQPTRESGCGFVVFTDDDDNDIGRSEVIEACHDSVGSGMIGMAATASEAFVEAAAAAKETEGCLSSKHVERGGGSCNVILYLGRLPPPGSGLPPME
jgi:hypothetical protein